MTTSSKSALVLLAALSAAACGDGSFSAWGTPPPHPSTTHCMTRAEFPEVVTAYPSCFGSSCTYNIITSIARTGSAKGYENRPQLTSGSNFLTAATRSGQSSATVGNGLYRPVDIRLRRGTQNAGIQRVFVEGLYKKNPMDMEWSVAQLLNILVVDHSNQCPAS